MSDKSKIFVCQMCHKRFTYLDFEDLKFFPSTGICRACYIQKMGDATVCFGKHEYFDSEKIVCRSICPDRHVCRLFIRLARRTRSHDNHR